MAMFFGPKSGSWWTSSAKDPRFNMNGRSDVGMFMCPEEAREAVAKRARRLKAPIPDDVECGYMKD